MFGYSLCNKRILFLRHPVSIRNNTNRNNNHNNVNNYNKTNQFFIQNKEWNLAAPVLRCIIRARSAVTFACISKKPKLSK